MNQFIIHSLILICQVNAPAEKSPSFITECISGQFDLGHQVEVLSTSEPHQAWPPQVVSFLIGQLELERTRFRLGTPISPERNAMWAQFADQADFDMVALLKLKLAPSSQPDLVSAIKANRFRNQLLLYLIQDWGQDEIPIEAVLTLAKDQYVSHTTRLHALYVLTKIAHPSAPEVALQILKEQNREEHISSEFLNGIVWLFTCDSFVSQSVLNAASYHEIESGSSFPYERLARCSLATTSICRYVRHGLRDSIVVPLGDGSLPVGYRGRTAALRLLNSLQPTQIHEVLKELRHELQVRESWPADEEVLLARAIRIAGLDWLEELAPAGELSLRAQLAWLPDRKAIDKVNSLLHERFANESDHEFVLAVLECLQSKRPLKLSTDEVSAVASFPLSGWAQRLRNSYFRSDANGIEVNPCNCKVYSIPSMYLPLDDEPQSVDAFELELPRFSLFDTTLVMPRKFICHRDLPVGYYLLSPQDSRGGFFED